jgi:hypothetical protein
MDTVTKAAPSRTGVGMAAADLRPHVVRRDPASPEHGCALPGYLQLPDLAMLWQCVDCGETWQVVADGRPPGSPLEFVWVRDPIQRAESRAP